MENIKKNISYNVIYQILIIILPLITAPYISRVMGADVLGQYSYSYSVVYYFSLFILLIEQLHKLEKIRMMLLENFVLYT